MGKFSLLLSQLPDGIPVPEVHGVAASPLWGLVEGASTLLYFVLFFYMLYHCNRNDPDSRFWFWIIIIAQPLGLIAYILVRFLPSREIHLPDFFRRWTRHRELTRLEIAAEQIGNPYQYILWGDALRDVRKFDQAGEAYRMALAKEPQNLQALWGAAQVALVQKRFEDTKSLTAQIIERDPEYKFGDALLAHGRALFELGDIEGARTVVEQHVRRWRHPESLYLLAEIHDRLGDARSAKDCLTMLVKDINASPTAIARRYSRWKSMAQRMLRKLSTP